MPALKISVVTPSFNQSEFVAETLDSVLSQNYPGLEYIVIDGASTDGSREIIERYRSRLHYFVSEPDLGHGNALNKGLSRATGEIMAWLNSDDKYLPWTLQTVSEIFAQFPDINWIVGTTAWWNDRGAMTGARNIYKNVFDYLYGDFRWIQQESVFWRKALWQRAGGRLNESYKLMVDGELWTRFFRLDELWHVHCILSGYRVHKTNRAAQRRDECLAEMHKAIEAMRNLMDDNALARRHRDYLVLNYDPEISAWRKRSIKRG
jgi:glycosyltransferase involved in cell wall biosynthesis